MQIYLTLRFLTIILILAAPLQTAFSQSSALQVSPSVRYSGFEHGDDFSNEFFDRRDLTGEIYDALLNQRLQEIMQKGNPPFAFAGVNDGEFLGGINAYSCFAALKPDGIEKGLGAIIEEMYRVKQTGFTATELEREKQNMLTKMDEQFKERDKTESSKYVQEYLP